MYIQFDPPGYFFRNKAIVGAQLSTFNTHGIMEQATESTTAQQLSQGIIGVGSSGTSLSENMTESKSVARFSFGGERDSIVSALLLNNEQEAI